MCFLLQTLLLVGASAIVFLVAGVAHLPLWLGAVGAFALLAAAWFAYLVYQTKNPEWWPPWDEGLPKEMRMLNVFVPVAMILVLGLIVVPVFQKARQKATERRLRTEQKHRSQRSSDALKTELLDLGLQFSVIR